MDSRPTPPARSSEEPLTDWTDPAQRKFTRENIARHPDAPFPYRALLELLDALDAALSVPPQQPDRLDVLRAELDRAAAMIDDPTRYIEVSQPYRAGWLDAVRAIRDELGPLAALRSPATEEKHQHRWVDARNKYVISGEMCPDCGAIRSSDR